MTPAGILAAKPYKQLGCDEARPVTLATRSTPIPRRFVILLLFCIVCYSAFTYGQTVAPKPDPAFQKLQIFLGHWTYKGEYKPGPLGPGGKVDGEYNYQFVLNGFLVEGHTTEKMAQGVTHFLEIDSYDPRSKSILMNVYTDDGSRYSGVIATSNDSVTWAGKLQFGDTEYHFRQVFVISKDHLTAQEHGEISADGKTWIPFFEASCTKRQR